MIKQILVLGFFSFCIVVNAREIVVEKHFIDAQQHYPRVNAGLMKIISLAETSGNQYTLSFLAYPEQAKKVFDRFTMESIKHRVAAYDSKRYIFSVFPKPSDAIKAMGIINSAGVDSYDIGLMQVNSKNAKRLGWDESRLFTDISYNVDKGASILDGCIASNHGLEAAIECYNKGTHNQYSYSYYRKVFALANK